MGRLVVQHLTLKLAGGGCVCVCLTGQAGHKHRPVDCGNAEDTLLLLLF